MYTCIHVYTYTCIYVYMYTYVLFSAFAHLCIQPFGGICDDPQYIDALHTVEQVARLSRDDVLLRICSRRRVHAQKKRAAAGSDTAKELRRKAEEEAAAWQQKRLEMREIERRAKLDEAGAKEKYEAARAKAAEERRKEVEARGLERREQEEQRQKLARQSQDAYWLQVEFPQALAKKLLRWRSKLKKDEFEATQARVDFLASFRRCNSSSQTCPHLWDEDKRLTSALGAVTGPDKTRHAVRCSKAFEWVLYEDNWAAGVPHSDACFMLGKLLERILPNGKKLFSTRFTTQVLLHDNMYVVEKAFLNAVFLMYQWLGPGWLPGQWNWPPSQVDLDA